MNFRTVRIELIIPLFTGVLCSLFVCTFITFDSGVYRKTYKPQVVSKPHEEDARLLFSSAEIIEDPILEYFRNPEFREWVVDFFSAICSNREIAWAILDNADKYNVSPALAFALSWEESRFNPRAVNRHNRDGSIDRGLFQLNNRSFPSLDNTSFFDIKSNAYHGVGHLRFCLDTGGTEVSALAMYNAGTGRVRSSGAPEVTLNYISRILENRIRLETRFHARLIKEEESRLTHSEENKEKNNHPFFSRTLSTRY